MKEIGRLFGVTSHVIGRKLKKLGLRTDEGKPSRKAHEEGYCDQKWTRDARNYLWAWHQGKTVEALEAAGMKRVEPAKLID
jgi:hypothetical protein